MNAVTDRPAARGVPTSTVRPLGSITTGLFALALSACAYGARSRVPSVARPGYVTISSIARPSAAVVLDSLDLQRGRRRGIRIYGPAADAYVRRCGSAVDAAIAMVTRAAVPR